MLRMATNRTAAVVAIATLAIALGAFASAPSSVTFVAQPAALSIQGGNLFQWSAPANPTHAHLELSSLDGRVVVPVFDGLFSPSGSLEVTPAQLAPFAIGERVVLRGDVGGRPTESTYAVVASRPEGSGWTLNVPATAVVFSTRDSTLTFRTVNPKSKPLPINLKLKFKNLKGKVVANWKYPVIALPGESVHSVTVPLSVCNDAKLKGANSLKTLLLKDGYTKAQGQSLLDWDLIVSTSSDKSAGNAPLNVSFTALVSGGVAPYIYNWDYDDGSAHGDAQNPNHIFLRSGVFDVVLTVMDSRGGVVSADPVVIVVQ
jgi:hypothetical protein